MKTSPAAALIVSALIESVSGLSKLYSDQQPDIRQIAIIGAGAAGSTAASYLQKYAAESGVAINVTIFEKTDHIGGRTLTVNPFDDPGIRLELGASIFIEKNKILYDSLAEFGLSKRDPDEGTDPTLGIWDGDDFVFTINQDDSYWWNAGKAILRYGFLAPRRTQQLMEATIGKFLKLYEEPYFPFRSLTQRVYDLDLVRTTGVTGEQLLKGNNIGDLYAHDIVQASTRVNYASNIGAIHGLDTMVSMAPEGAMAVAGGNWQIFHKMVEKSGANLVLNTSIISIDFAEKSDVGGPAIFQDVTNDQKVIAAFPLSDDQVTPEIIRDGEESKKYKLTSTSESYSNTFDNIIIATPWQFANISTEDGVIQQVIDKIPYVRLHVTLFASPFRYSPKFFGKEEGAAIPATVLTTLSKEDDASSGVQGAGKAGFFSISTLRKGVNPRTQREEYLYKIFSPEKVTPEFLTRLFGISVPDTVVDVVDQDVGERASPISWYYPHVFNSYPKALPRVTFQDPVVGQGIYYTSGMESFISTMETSALMGKNVARLVIDEILEEEAKVEENGEKSPHRVECDRGGLGALKNGEVPKTRPVQPMFEDV
ncbi:Prenylcysteine lyase domain containing protein [Rhypophila sp. PSN 637]